MSLSLVVRETAEDEIVLILICSKSESPRYRRCIEKEKGSQAGRIQRTVLRLSQR